MRRRPLFWLFLSMLFFAAAAWFWRLGDEWAAKSKAAVPKPDTNQPASDPKKTGQSPASVDRQDALRLLTQPTPRDYAELAAAAHERKNRARYPNRLTNTTRSLNDLKNRDTAILLQNALLDTEQPLSVAIPGQLQSTEDPGSYIVQSKGPINDAFRAQLKQAGAQIVSYIPNNAYLVRATKSVVDGLAAQPLTQAVLPYEPYYKLTPFLLDLAVKQQPLPDNGALNVLLFADAHDATIGELKELGAEVLGEGTSPFGPIVKVRSPADSIAAVAGLKGVQQVELVRARFSANDLSRVTTGVAVDTQVTTNYLGLTGSGVTVNVNDTGVDATHPDLAVLGDVGSSLVDASGHGTHVAGIIASTGGKSTTVTFAQGSVMPPTNGQFRGKAPNAKIFSMNYLDSDSYLQQTAAQTNVLISNNSWNNGDAAYDLSAASYDAAVRDALPTIPGSRPLLYVFSAGNGGQVNEWDDGANDDGTGGAAGSILSPGTAKNVITVGALEQMRSISNDVVICTPSTVTSTNSPSCQTNKEWLPSSDTDDQVARFSNRGNVGIGLEGPFGRFKPDVVAPGSFVVSTRSAQWDQASYYNPTGHVGPPALLGLEIATNSLFQDTFFIPANAVKVTIDVVGQSPAVPIPIFVRQSAAPSTNTYDFVRTNHVSIPPDTALNPVNVGWFYALGNPSPSPVTCNVFIDITVTNEHGNFLQVLQSMNAQLGQFYRYESGTSMSAADVSGMLALMQEFFEQRLRVTNSPALMKALLINGARSVGNYNLQVQNSINFQGWGLVDLTNTVQQALVAQPPAPATSGKYYFDQNVNPPLATGDSQTFNIRVNPASGASDLPLRITLAWTDPPGNPIASVKLVNDLDLVVTNTDNPTVVLQDVFFGNDIQSGNDFNSPWDTNNAPNIDSVNNVENVYLLPPLGTNYSITVRGKRVNVNAVTAHPNNVVQDFALVISSGDGETNGALTLLSSAPGPVTTTPVTIVTNDFATSPTDFGQILDLQRAGGSTPLLGTNSLTTAPLGLQAQDTAYEGRITIGITNQWHFYVFTNNGGAADFTNVAFVVLNENTVSIPRMGVDAGFPANATRQYPDIDLYVSQDPTLLQLDPLTIAAADKSLSRGGDEAIIYSNSVVGTVYYIGVKAECQEGVEYTFFGDSSPIPFGSQDSQGDFLGIGHPALAPIPDDNAEGASILVLAFGHTLPKLVRRVVATNEITHELMGDLVGTLTHRGTRNFVVLNNHAPDTPVVNRKFIYDDTGHVPGARRTDGPGSLLNFRGQKASGIWKLTEVDDAFGHVGTNDQFGLFLENEPDLGQGVNFELIKGQCDDAFFTVPPEATNLTLTVLITNGTGPLFVQICTFDAPECAAGCKSTVMSAPGGSISIGPNDTPPINGGTYIVTFCNQGPDTVDFFAIVTNQLGPSLEGTGVNFAANSPVPIIDDAVTTSIKHIATTNAACIRTLEVGVRINHPRVSDLVLHLISPDGTRLLLCENRGGLSTEGMGSDLSVTNIIPVSSSGGPEASTNVVDTGLTSGTISIDYNMFQIPDDMRIFYGTNLIFDTGLVSGAATLNINYGPTNGQISTLITIIMNQGGNTDTNTAWEYTLTSAVAQYIYLTFTEDLNETITPIKFAVPPFTNANYIGTNDLLTNQIFYLPEDSLGLNRFAGLSPNGDWKLEVWDNRVGATNPQPMLVSWQLSFQFENVTPAPQLLTDDNPVTNTVGPNEIMYFEVQVPCWASFATNWLVSASGNVNVLFKQTGLPSGTNGPGDYTLLANSTGGTSVLTPGTMPPPPPLVPCATYFIGIQNTTATPVTFVFQVNFNVTPLALDVPISSVMPSNSVPRYFSYDVTTNESGIWFQLTNLTGNVDLVASLTPFPDLSTFTYGSFNPGTNNESIIVFTNSDPIPLTPGHWYLGVFNQDTTNVNYTIVVTDFTNPVPPIITLQNMVPYDNTNYFTNAIDYYRYVVSNNAMRGQFEIDNPSGDVTLVARKGLPLPDLSNYSVISANPGTNNELIVLFPNSTPVPLSPGEWFLSAVNVSGAPVTYTIMASDWPSTGLPIQIVSEQIVGGTFCITWNSLAGNHYFVEGKTSLFGPWTAVSPTITGTLNTTTWCLPLPSPYQYFRVREGFAP